MTSPLVIYLDDALCLEVARAGGVPGQLRALFARLDADMDAGIELDGEWVAAPETRQRCRFVLGELVHALADGRQDFARSLLAYLAARWPELLAVHVLRTEDGWDVRLEQD